jgi:hypothetical protein
MAEPGLILVTGAGGAHSGMVLGNKVLALLRVRRRAPRHHGPAPSRESV